jgi:hypothetical protein
MITKTLTQAIDYQKTMVDNTYSIMTTLQDQGIQMMDTAFENNTFLPEGTKKVCDYWNDFIKQNQQDCKTYIDTSFDRVKVFFDATTPEKPEPKKAPASKAKK